MKRIITSLGLLFSIVAFSQSYVGFLNDNYSGVHAVINNPANIVDSRFKVDINLFGMSAFLGNDYASAKFSDLLDKDFDFDQYVKRNPLSANEAVFNVDILGPSFMFNIAPKHSIAVSTRLRIMQNAKANGELYETINNIGDDWDYVNPMSVNIGDAMAKANAWTEVGLSYATVLMDKKEHFLKGGLTLKYLRGTATGNFETNNATLKYQPSPDPAQPENAKVITSGKAYYSYSSNFKNAKDIELSDFKESIGNGFGGDLGFTYEWRPEINDYKIANGKGYYRDVNKYKLRLGLSVTDLGSIRYSDKVIKENYNLNAVITKTEYENVSKDDYSKALDELFTKEAKGDVSNFNLPTAVHFNADWNFNNKFYLNLDANFDIANSEKGNTIENTYSLTPRYEAKWFSAYVPLSIREFSGFNAGLGFRAGPLYVGSGSIITNLLGKESKGADVYLGLKIPIYHSRPKDKDQDGILDKFDNCPNTFGPVENDGCPWGDKDKDGVKDNVDKCPDTAGPIENKGCPWGDKDKDGVKDNVDKCPNTAGSIENKGCPWGDKDKDGVKDNVDKCPNTAGPAENKGCPWGDRDKDGVTDNLDKCPDVKGVKENNGCPKKVVITKEAKKTIDSYARSIYFNSGKTTFRAGVTQTLDRIVGVMKEYKDAKFSIEGHTDSQGRKASNRRLSERRAKAVLDYLVSKGVNSSRLTSYGFGEDYPIDTNKTRKGRANNRRVEIKLTK